MPIANSDLQYGITLCKFQEQYCSLGRGTAWIYKLREFLFEVLNANYEGGTRKINVHSLTIPLLRQKDSYFPICFTIRVAPNHL
jgi:hypothetical protein